MRFRQAAWYAPAAAALLALTMSAGPAQAATGTFFYTEQPGDLERSLTNPADNMCFNLGNGGGPISNQTDRVANVYFQSNCTGGIFGFFNPGSNGTL
ncbi:hypothetical protein GCM10010218_39240 [Streptomyces mashuensis]|uniref:Uncharacterized protein n=1 Tax=Streptomyces mashuensis TaxID=33904 RepID=A0A919B559_9ACTN|nr:hypothetical protein [Streptomyces mashuensis]GHF54155.1 hypothetical protein GCM10010218_39240 [Streptomyces mashuensis]